MANEGNTGQHWKLSKVEDSKVAGLVTITTLSCGHKIRVTHKTHEDAMWSMEYDHQRIGRKQRCNECVVE